MKEGVYIFAFVIVLLCFFSFVEGKYVISNSEDWRDVYSSVNYANLLGYNYDFLVSSAHSKLLLKGISKNNEIEVISSSKNPIIVNYPFVVKQENFLDVEDVVVRDANLDLIERLTYVENFIIVSDSFGYNAIAVASYAVVSDSWVFLANRGNIAEIENILDNRDVNNVLIYGYVDREVIENLNKFNPKIINNNDRFKDNIEIVKRYLELEETKQVLLTNGEFIEKELMSGTSPVLFTGRMNVPDVIEDFISDSDFEVGVLIGNNLVNAATNIRRSTGISVIAKFARSARNPSSGISAIEGLDLFYVPGPLLDLEISSIRYNTAVSRLEIVYKSNSNVPVYFMGSINLRGGGESVSVGDLNPEFISPNDFKTVTYSIDANLEEPLLAEVYTLYGDVYSSLDYVLEKDYDVDFVDIIDRCDIDIDSVKYNKQKEAFVISTNNVADVDCWVSIELNDIVINGVERTVGMKEAVKLNSGENKRLIIFERMDDFDLEDNSFVELVSYSGEKQDLLVNVFRGRFPLKIEMFSMKTYLFVGIFLIILFLTIVMIYRRRKYAF